MNRVLGVVIALTLFILAFILYKPALRWVFTRIPPETPAGWEPRFRYWVGGVECPK